MNNSTIKAFADELSKIAAEDKSDRELKEVGRQRAVTTMAGEAYREKHRRGERVGNVLGRAGGAVGGAAMGKKFIGGRTGTMAGAGLGYMTGGHFGRELGTEHDIKKNASLIIPGDVGGVMGWTRSPENRRGEGILRGAAGDILGGAAGGAIGFLASGRLASRAAMAGSIGGQFLGAHLATKGMLKKKNAMAAPQLLLHMIYRGDVGEAKKGRAALLKQLGNKDPHGDIAAHDTYISKHSSWNPFKKALKSAGRVAGSEAGEVGGKAFVDSTGKALKDAAGKHRDSLIAGGAAALIAKGLYDKRRDERVADRVVAGLQKRGSDEKPAKPPTVIGTMARSLGGMALGTVAGYGAGRLAEKAMGPGVSRFIPLVASGAGLGLGAIYPYMKAQEAKELRDAVEHKRKQV